MKTNKWIFAIVLASMAWMGCDDDDDDPTNKPELNDTDETFVETAAKSNMAEIELGELASTKATDPLVKNFAQQMINDHTAVQNELKSLADNYDGIDWPESLDRHHDSIKNELDNVSGYTFDTLYIKSQVMMHESAVSLFQSASGNATDQRVKAFANKHLPHLEMHLEKADSVHMAVTTTNNNMNEDGEGTTDGGTTDGGTTDGGTTDGGTTDDGTTDGGTTDGGTTDGGTDGGTTDGGTS